MVSDRTFWRRASKFAEIAERSKPLNPTREFVRDTIEKLYYSVWVFDAENKSTAQVDAAQLFDEDTIAVGAKRVRLRGSVAPAKILW